MSRTSDESPAHTLGRILFYVLLVVFLIAVVLLTPGIVVIALVADLFSLALTPSQMWAFSFVISVVVFFGLRVKSPNSKVAGKHYLVISGIFTTICILFLFGLKSPIAARSVVRFFPPKESPSAIATTTGSSNDAGESTETQVEVRRALPISQASPILTPFQSSPTESVASQVFYFVAGVVRGDTLNVRNGPGATYNVTQKLPNGYRGIQIVGTPVINDTTEWVHITFENQSGWACKQFLEAE